MLLPYYSGQVRANLADCAAYEHSLLALLEPHYVRCAPHTSIRDYAAYEHSHVPWRLALHTSIRTG